jgi:hypothetical protein
MEGSSAELKLVHGRMFSINEKCIWKDVQQKLYLYMEGCSTEVKLVVYRRMFSRAETCLKHRKCRKENDQVCW